MQKDLDSMRSSLRSAGASSGIGLKPARSASATVGWHPTGHGLPERIDRAEVSALWDRPRHGQYLTRELTKEGMLQPRKPPPPGAVPPVRPLTASGALVHQHVLSRATSAPGLRAGGAPGGPPGSPTGTADPANTPWRTAEQVYRQNVQRMGLPAGPAVGLRDATGLRVSKLTPSKGLPMPPSVPSNRSEAVRL